jgi:exoribonuclease R
VAEHPGSFGIKSLFRHLGYSQRDYTEFRRVLHQLFDSSEIERRGKRRLFIPQKEVIIEGILRLTPHGYGFVDRGDMPSVFIGAREARKACDGDRITVSVFDSGHEAGPEGRILEVDDPRGGYLRSTIATGFPCWAD